MNKLPLLLVCFYLFSSCFFFKPALPADPKEDGTGAVIPSDPYGTNSAELGTEGYIHSDVYMNPFLGVSRAAAKTGVSPSKTEIFSQVGGVLKTLKPDAEMRKMGIGESSPRIEIENRNVYIRDAYIFSIKKESDGDFHIIIGDVLADGTKVNMMNAEISGLPRDTTTYNFKVLRKSRSQLFGQFPELFGRTSKKTFLQPPYPHIAIRGSLFFDTHHQAGEIGGANAKPTTVWEVHPITYLKFK
jgi:hypothetical protein